MISNIGLVAASLLAAWGARRTKSLKRLSLPSFFLVIALGLRILANIYPHILGATFESVVEKVLLVVGFWLGAEIAQWLITFAILEKVLKVPLQLIAKNIISAALYVAAALILLPTVFGIRVTTVLTTSAILTVIVGLALQDLLGNLFAGVALNVEKTFSRGDWVRIGDHIGVVSEVSWRATKIKTIEQDLVIIPNSVVSKSVIMNFSVPSKLDVLTLAMGAAYDAAPGKVKQVLLQACHKARGVRKRPEPIVRVTGYGDFAINYELRVWIDQYSAYKDVRDELYSLIWYLFKRNNITIPYPVRDLHIKTASGKEEMQRKRLKVQQTARELRQVPLFAPLGDADIELLASEAPTMQYYKGEAVVKQGEPGESFFLIRSGRLNVIAKDEAGEEVQVASLGRGEYFGGMSLLTGEARNATVVVQEDAELLVIDKEMFNKVLVAKPQIAEELGKRLAERELDLQSKLAASKDQKVSRPTMKQRQQLYNRLVRRIKGFFKLQQPD